MNTFKGPLGSHRNFVHHIALENYHEYRMLCGLNDENGKDATPDRYKEFRYFLNCIESINNILDYFYFENENELQHSKLKDFKKAVWNKYPELEKLADLANAYKHCVREGFSGKNTSLPWAKDLQRPQLNIDVTISPSNGVSTSVEYDFPWPIPEHEEVLGNAVKFWIEYVQPGGCDLKSV